MRVQARRISFLLTLCVLGQSAAAAVPTLKTNRSKSGIESASEVEIGSGRALPQGERILYPRILEAYQKGQYKKLERLQQKLARTYPNSVYNDNALYFRARLLIEQGVYSEGIKILNEQLRLYPNGNKRAAALMLKAQAYNRLNLPSVRMSILQEIIRYYPGSPEARRAQMDLQLAKQ